MVELFEQDIATNDRQSSKGNQLKWKNQNIWYKADYTGYEGLTEYVISELLKKSSLTQQEYVHYKTEEIRYKYNIYFGCSSENFLPEGWQFISLERLFQNYYGVGLNKSLYSIRDHENRLRFLVEQTERVTGLKDFGIYMSKLLTVDSFFKNEDRHTHNIAVLMDETQNYHYCPIFDNGASLLSDTTQDYPIHVAIEEMMNHPRSKTFCPDFDEQLDLVEKLYGQQIKFEFTKKDVWDILEAEPYYEKELKERVAYFILAQQRKYSYLFK